MLLVQFFLLASLNMKYVFPSLPLGAMSVNIALELILFPIQMKPKAKATSQTLRQFAPDRMYRMIKKTAVCIKYFSNTFVMKVVCFQSYFSITVVV